MESTEKNPYPLGAEVTFRHASSPATEHGVDTVVGLVNGEVIEHDGTTLIPVWVNTAAVNTTVYVNRSNVVSVKK